MPVAQDILLRQSFGLARSIFATVTEAKDSCKRAKSACCRAAMLLKEFASVMLGSALSASVYKLLFLLKVLMIAVENAAWLSEGHEPAFHNVPPWICSGGLWLA
ncbi:hypothetical protein ABBQ32_008733 [Trebouxia sp. C0010 RCD-2024]